MAAPQSGPIAHPGPWTLQEWLELPEGPPYTELIDGLLVMSPVSAYRNQRLMLRLTRQLEQAAPVEYEVLPEVNVKLGGDRALIPDFCVIDIPGFDGVALSVKHVVLVGEVLSPSTRVYDRTTKRALYADAGVASLLLVDPDEISAVCYELHGGEYVEAGRSVQGQLRLERPFSVTLDLIPPTPR